MILFPRNITLDQIMNTLPESHQAKQEFNKKIARIQALESAINETIGWVNSTGGCEETIRPLRRVMHK